MYVCYKDRLEFICLLILESIHEQSDRIAIQTDED